MSDHDLPLIDSDGHSDDTEPLDAALLSQLADKNPPNEPPFDPRAAVEPPRAATGQQPHVAAEGAPAHPTDGHGIPPVTLQEAADNAATGTPVAHSTSRYAPDAARDANPTGAVSGEGARFTTSAPDPTAPTLPPLSDAEMQPPPADVGRESRRTPAHAKKTLAGSGGFDPNPDFGAGGVQRTTQPNIARDGRQIPPDGSTLPHYAPPQHTLVHIPGETRDQPRVPPPRRTDTQRRARTPHTPPPPMPPAAPMQPTLQNSGRRERTIPSPRVSEYSAPIQASVPPTGTPQPPAYPGYGQGQPPYQQGYGAPRPLPPRRKPRQRRILGCTPGCLAIFVGVFVTFCGGLTLLTLVLTATLGSELQQRLEAQLAPINTYDNFESTFFYDRNGALLYEAFSEGRRTNVQYANFPQDLINATIAIEDDSFFTNPGFEIQATLRGFFGYVGLESVFGVETTGGGSTITQQLVRNVLFAPEYRSEYSIQRKVEEILLAFLLRQQMPPEQVLELYLNEIYYGNLSYGAQAAARTFFDKDVSALTLGEAALLAGLPQAPANLDPLNPDPAIQAAVNSRWQLVLDRMVQERFITDAQRDQALAAGLVYTTPEAPLNAPHFTVFAQNRLVDLMAELGYSSDQIARGGLRVYTTLDLPLNDMAQNIARDQVTGLAANRVSNAAVLILKPLTGEILAMVGSIDYDNDAIQGRVNVTNSPRQPGSTVKAWTYAAALESGMTAADAIWDTPTDIAGYRPVNYDRQFHGVVRMRGALANSYNIPAVQTLRQIGVPSLLSFAQRFGVNTLGTDASLYGLSLTLGGGEVTLLELTRSYTVFANGGSFVPTSAILCILNTRDEILYEYEDGCPRGTPTSATVVREGYGSQVLDPRIAFTIGDILSDNAARSPAMGSNSPLYTPGIGSSVKTGTTDDFRDNWTVGYTRNVAIGVWVGNSDGTPMVNTSGLSGAAPIWNALMTTIHNDPARMRHFTVDGGLLPDRLDPPQGISLRPICNIASLREPSLDCPGTVNEWLLDTPAAVPAGDGSLQYPPAPARSDQPPSAGPWLREVEPSLFRVLALPLPPNAVTFNVPLGQNAPPSPIYCQVPIEAASVAPGAREQLFIAPPPVPEDAVQAELYARANGIPFLPTIACTPELLQIGGSSPAVVTAFISQPTPGQAVVGSFPVLGTAQFANNQASYFKLEISGGQFGESWVTMGEINPNSVVNGQLGTIPAEALSPGTYRINLVVVGLDGNYVQPPYQVEFVVS
jgi:membrane peptidoglycan carboxypeptidase